MMRKKRDEPDGDVDDIESSVNVKEQTTPTPEVPEQEEPSVIDRLQAQVTALTNVVQRQETRFERLQDLLEWQIAAATATVNEGGASSSFSSSAATVSSSSLRTAAAAQQELLSSFSSSSSLRSSSRSFSSSSSSAAAAAQQEQQQSAAAAASAGAAAAAAASAGTTFSPRGTGPWSGRPVPESSFCSLGTFRVRESVLTEGPVLGDWSLLRDRFRRSVRLWPSLRTRARNAKAAVVRGDRHVTRNPEVSARSTERRWSAAMHCVRRRPQASSDGYSLLRSKLRNLRRQRSIALWQKRKEKKKNKKEMKEKKEKNKKEKKKEIKRKALDTFISLSSSLWCSTRGKLLNPSF
uniref:Uncharacterized protein n=1 Tax=Ananas comosus var. bracteatus TaxID=296719 RepID=A0A6V7PGP2_ANACO|nr:unnamed protein product [Ananas comosus var. bracteatus]